MGGRGHTVDRSASETSAGPTGNPGLAFQDIAEMSGYPTGGLGKGTVAEMLSLQTLWLLDPTSTLAPDVSAAAPLGITVVAASGGGNWLRAELPGLRWQGQATWFIDAAAGDDEADGATALTPIATQAEWQRRVGGKPTVAQVVTFQADSAENMNWYLENTVAATVTVVGSLSAPLYTGSITAAPQNWDVTVTPPTDARITDAALPVSWTASGLVDKIGVLTSGPHTGKTFWISKDLGAKTARASEPIDSFGFAHGVFTNGDDFTIHDMTNLSGEHHFVGVGEISFIAVNLQFGTILGASHQSDVNSGPWFYLDSGLQGFDFQGSCSVQAIGCQVNKGRLFDTAGVGVEAGYCFEGYDAHQGSKISFANTYAEGGSCDVDADASVNISGAGQWFGICGYTSGFTFGPSARLDCTLGRIFTIDVTGGGSIGLAIEAAAVVAYDQLPDFTGAATAMTIGGRATTVAELPWTNPINGAAVVDSNPTNQIEDQFDALTVDTTIGAGQVADLCTLTLNVNGSRRVQFWSSFCIQIGASGSGFAFLEIDGVQVAASGLGGVAGIAPIEAGAINWEATLLEAANPHTIKLRMRCTAVTLACRPALVPDSEHATLMSKELYG